jgi:hypothetical protein
MVVVVVVVVVGFFGGCGGGVLGWLGGTVLLTESAGEY